MGEMRGTQEKETFKFLQGSLEELDFLHLKEQTKKGWPSPCPIFSSSTPPALFTYLFCREIVPSVRMFSNPYAARGGTEEKDYEYDDQNYEGLIYLFLLPSPFLPHNFLLLAISTREINKKNNNYNRGGRPKNSDITWRGHEEGSDIS